MIDPRTEPDPADEPLLPLPPAPARPAKRGAPWLVVVMSVVFGLLCLAAAAAVVLSDRGETAVSVEVGELVAERATALQAARERTATLTTYDHRTLDADVQAVLATATGEFEAEYTQTVQGQGLRETFVQTQAVAQGTVIAAGLEGEVVDSGQGDRAVVIVAVDQVITTTGAAPRTERNRLRMELVRPEETWLVSKVQRL